MTWHRDEEGKRHFGLVDILWIAGIIALVILIVYLVMVQAYASHGTTFAPCKNDGIYDGQENPFSQELFEMCGDTYYDYFIAGCMSVNNTREVCEQATDAGE